MSGENKKVRSRKRKPSKLLHWLNTEGRRYCAVALCASLIAGNLGQFASIADDGKDSDYEFEMSRLSIYEALQEAVADGNTVDKEFKFQGIEAESYDSLMETDGTLYELFPEIEGGDRHVDLRVFTRLTGDIALDGTYQIDGEEEVIFMLNNDLDAEKTATIIVDDKKTEPIVLTPKSAIAVSGEDDPYISASEFTQENEEITLEPEGNEEKSEVTTDDTEVSVVEDATENESENETEEVVIEDESEDASNIEEIESEDAEEIEEAEVEIEIEAAASISNHKVYRVASAATPSDAEAEDTATPSDATSSDADATELDGQAYEAVLMDGTAANAFVTTLADMDVSNLLVLMASPANAGKMHTAEIDGIIVKAWVNNGILPDDAQLVVTKLDEENNTEQYQSAVEALEQAGTQYGGMMALDIAFQNEAGEEIEPDGNVQVSIEMNKDALPADVDPDMMSVQHLKEVETGIEVQTVADSTADTNGTVEATEDATIAAAFEVESFSTFTITWSQYFKITVHYVNTNGNDLDKSDIVGTINNDSISENKTITFADYSNKVTTGLVYKGAYYGTYDGREVTSVTAKTEGYGNNKTPKLIFDDGITLTYNKRNPKVVTADVYLVYERADENPSTPINPVRELTKSKTATYISDDYYELELSISGAIGSSKTKVPVDILLILDTSRSMEWYINSKQDSTAPSGERRIDYVATAIKSLTDSVGKNQDIDAKYSLVQFAGNSQTKVLVDWSEGTATKINSQVAAIDPNGGTNYQAGIGVGINQLAKARENAQKVVIFLTDGIPTYRGLVGNKQSGTGAPSDYENMAYGNNENQNSAEETIKGMNCDAFYAIGVGPDFKTGTTNSVGIKNLDGLCNNVGSDVTAWYSALSTDDLNKAFDDIKSKLNYILCSNVLVFDTLSDMVDFDTASATTSGTPNEDLTVKITDKDGKEYTGKGSYTLPKTDQNGETTVRAEYVAENRQIQLVFPTEYKLEAGWTYSVVATIKVNEKAYKAYRDNRDKNEIGYTDTGDAETGTHSEKLGFFSNDQAKVTYKYNNENKDESFDKPVVQVRPGKLVIEKEITGLDEKTKDTLAESLGFEVTLDWSGRLSDEKIPSGSFIVSPSAADSWRKMEVADSGDGFSYRWELDDLSPDTTYTIKEIGANIPNYNRTTTITGGNPVANDPDSVNGIIARDTTETVKYTNSYTRSSVKLTVTKTVTGNMGDDKKEFEFKAYLENTDEGFSESTDGKYRLDDKKTASFKLKHNGEITIDIPYGATVKVEEVSPTGYTPSYTIVNGDESKDSSATGDKSESLTATVTSIIDDVTIAFTNKKDDPVDTGILLDSMPYVVILAAVAAGGAFYFVRKKKEDEDDFE